MSQIIWLAIALVFFDGWARWVVIGLGLMFEVGEIALWLRWRKKRSITGSETLVGESGVALEDLDPAGQVKVRGQVWSATCPAGALEGDQVVVVRVDGIKLEVEARSPTKPRHPMSRTS